MIIKNSFDIFENVSDLITYDLCFHLLGAVLDCMKLCDYPDIWHDTEKIYPKLVYN